MTGSQVLAESSPVPQTNLITQGAGSSQQFLFACQFLGSLSPMEATCKGPRWMPARAVAATGLSLAREAQSWGNMAPDQEWACCGYLIVASVFLLAVPSCCLLSWMLLCMYLERISIWSYCWLFQSFVPFLTASDCFIWKCSTITTQKMLLLLEKKNNNNSIMWFLWIQPGWIKEWPGFKGNNQELLTVSGALCPCRNSAQFLSFSVAFPYSPHRLFNIPAPPTLKAEGGLSVSPVACQYR